MNPLIQSFTKNLSGCSGCGQVPQSVIDAISKGEKVKFNVMIEVEAESVKAAANKIPDEVGIVLSITPRPQQSVNVSNPFQRTTTLPTPQ